MAQANFVLVGPNQGRSITLGGYVFKEGVCAVVGGDPDIVNAKRILSRFYSAYADGPELRAAREDWEARSRGQEACSNLQGLLEESLKAHPAGSVQPAAPEGAPAAPSGPQPEPEPQGNPKLVAALKSLDPNNNGHWTQAGKPSLTALESAYGSADFTRSSIEAAMPGFSRETARALKAEG